MSESWIYSSQLTWWQKAVIRLGIGRVKAFKVPSISNPGQYMQFYYSWCKKHGYFLGYEHGFRNELRCPKCLLLRDDVR